MELQLQQIKPFAHNYQVQAQLNVPQMLRVPQNVKLQLVVISQQDKALQLVVLTIVDVLMMDQLVLQQMQHVLDTLHKLLDLDNKLIVLP